MLLGTCVFLITAFPDNNCIVVYVSGYCVVRVGLQSTRVTCASASTSAAVP